MFAFGLLLPLSEMIRLHPYEYTHFNHIAGTVRGADNYFMLDYWGLALKQASDGLREELVDLLKAERETIVIYASTDPREALQMGDDVILMAEGRAIQSGEPQDVYASPSTTRAAGATPVVAPPTTGRWQAPTTTHPARAIQARSPR